MVHDVFDGYYIVIKYLTIILKFTIGKKRVSDAELTRVLVIGKGKRIVSRKEQWCYIVRIPEIDDGTEFHIVKFNFAVTAAPKTPFPGKQNHGPWLRRKESILSGLLVVMLFQTWVKGETTPSTNSGAKESTWTMTTNQRQKTPKPPQ
jgi:hypothetical protein